MCFVFVVVVTTMVFYHSIENSVKDPVFYLLIFETVLYTSAVSYPACYLGTATLDYILPLLKITVSKFEEAVRNEDLLTLEGPIHGYK